MLQNIPRTPICKVMKGCIQRLKDSKIIVIEIVPGGIERYAYHKVSEKRGLIKCGLGGLCNHREESGTFGRHKKSGNKIKPSELINLVTATVNLIITLVAIIIKLM